MSRIIATTVYEYDELGTVAQAKARDWFREATAGDNYFAEYVLREAAEVAAMLGIALDTGKDGEPLIYWSGFSFQGDGASWEGSYSYKPGAVEAVREYAPQDSRLQAIAGALESVQGKNSHALQARCKVRGHYVHSGCMNVDIFDTQDIGADEWQPGTEQTMWETLRGFADWIYSELEAAYWADTADDAVADTIRANEYTFTAEGKRYG